MCDEDDDEDEEDQGKSWLNTKARPTDAKCRVSRELLNSSVNVSALKCLIFEDLVKISKKIFRSNAMYESRCYLLD